jgi:hypothetical protein
MSKSGDVWPEVRWRSGLIPDRRLESGEIFPVIPNIIDLRILFFYGGGVPGDTRELEGNYEAQQDAKRTLVLFVLVLAGIAEMQDADAGSAVAVGLTKGSFGVSPLGVLSFSVQGTSLRFTTSMPPKQVNPTQTSPIGLGSGTGDGDGLNATILSSQLAGFCSCPE